MEEEEKGLMDYLIEDIGQIAEGYEEVDFDQEVITLKEEIKITGKDLAKILDLISREGRLTQSDKDKRKLLFTHW